MSTVGLSSARSVLPAAIKMRVRLTRKLAERIDDVDLSGRRVGDVLDLPEPKARLLVAEEWATTRERRQDDGGPMPTERRWLESPPLHNDTPADRRPPS